MATRATSERTVLVISWSFPRALSPPRQHHGCRLRLSSLFPGHARGNGGKRVKLLTFETSWVWRRQLWSQCVSSALHCPCHTDSEAIAARAERSARLDPSLATY